MTCEKEIEQAAEILAASRHAVVLTGAGHSTASGIPDFRSPDTGLWQQVDPMEVASIYGFQRNPQAFYDWIRPLAKQMMEAQPNPAHYALAELEQMGVLKAVITRLRKARLEVLNADAVIVAERPAIAPHVAAMKRVLCPILGIKPDALGIKGKTNEGLGPIGQGKAIACLATVLLRNRSRKRPA